MLQAQSQLGVASGGVNQQNPASYDDLKKRLLNEYKKLVNKKGTTSAGGASAAAHSNDHAQQQFMSAQAMDAGIMATNSLNMQQQPTV